MRKYFKVHLSQRIAEIRQQQGLSIYMVAKRSGVAQNTVKKYAESDIETPYITAELIQLCEYLGLDWHNPLVVEVVQTNEDESSGQIKTQLATA